MKKRIKSLRRIVKLLLALTILAFSRTQAQENAGSLTPSAIQVPSGVSYTITITGTAASGCTGTGSYIWVMGTTEANAVQIAGNTQNLTYTGTWTSTTEIFREYICSNGSPVYTSPTTLVPQTPFTPGTVSASPGSVSSGGSSTLSATVSTGSVFGSTYTYQWQSSPDNTNWTNVGSSNTTDANYAATNINVATYFRQAVTSGPLTMYTNSVAVSIAATFSPGSVSPATTTINYGANGPLLGITGTSGGSGYTYQWQYSYDNQTWVTISNAISSTYTPLALTKMTYYNVLVTSGGQTLSTTSGLVTPILVNSVPAADNQTGNLNANMNWVLASGYDASGNIISQGKTFYDNSGNLIQTQSKVFYRSNATTVYTHVLATQPVKDAYGRQVLSTLPAPIDYADFNYTSNFLQAPDGTNYTYKNFDLYNPSGTQTDKTNTPDQVGSQTVKGTLGWYYGSSNNWEPYTPMTSYPYIRETIYRDGTNNMKKQANSGESFVMGSGHETSSYLVPAVGELNHYLSVRNKFFTNSLIGNLPASLFLNATLSTSKDQNGNEIVKMSDLDGHVLMTARPGSDISFTSNVQIADSITVAYAATIQGTDQLFIPNPTGTYITVYTGTTVFYAGAASSFSPSLLGAETGQVLCGLPFTYQNCPSGNCGTLAYAALQSTMAYFKILADATPVSITGGGYALYDMNTEAPISLINGNSLNRGFYKVVAIGGVVNLTYSNSFTDVSYNFYNQLGQLIATIAPNGVKQLYSTGINNYSTLTSIPYITTYSYNTQGQLVTTSDPDNGSGTVIYRMDGKVRFSQNALQVASGAYNYTNYDQYGRMIESGQYQPDANGIAFNSTAMTNILENTSSTGGLTTGTKTDVVVNMFDVPDPSLNQTGYTQDPANMANQVSTSQRYSSILNNSPSSTNLVSQTWYNYDEEGKVVWIIKYNPLLGANGFKTWDLTYDGLSRFTKLVFQKNVAAETFVHYYQYDPANGHLWTISTNTVDNPATAQLQATYIYYLHGPLKRIELAGNLQGIDYTYTLQGALKAINSNNKNADPGGDGSVNGFSPDQFGCELDYFTGDYVNSRTGVQPIVGVNAGSITTDSYAGNIKAMSWYSEKPAGLGLSDAPLTYVYNYDPKYQFISSTWGTGLNFWTSPASFTTTANNKESVVVPNSGTPGTPAYDLNGNILNLQRTNGTGALTDQFTYNYASTNNQLQSVVNNASGSPVTYAAYTYDVLGRETSENLGSPTLNKYIQYDARGKVKMVARDAGFTQPVVQFVYDESGNRIEKLSYNSSFQLTQATYYFGDVIYTQTVTNNVYGPLTPQEYQIHGSSGRLGIFYKQSNIYAYQLTDHLGNVRAVVALNAGTCQVRMYNDYYPFGMVLQSGGTNDYRYDYQGNNSEKDGETSWNDFELRMYNSRIARWFTIDPAMQYWSPYEAMGNDPASSTDPDGGFDWYAHQNSSGFIVTYYDPGHHESAQFTEGEWYVNVGEDDLTQAQVDINAEDYFDNSFQTYFGNFHNDMFSNIGGYYQEIYDYQNPARYSNYIENATQPWMEYAKGEIGEERAANGDPPNPRILEYLHSVTDARYTRTDKTPWCTCFVNWSLQQAGVQGPNTARAFDVENYGVTLDQPAYGAIAIMKYSHATFVAGRNYDGRLVFLGGNQGPHAVTLSPVGANKVEKYVYPVGWIPNYNLPIYHLEGPSLNYQSTH